MSDRARLRAFLALCLARLRESYREPEVLFWAFVFPVLLSAALAVAFRDRPPEPGVRPLRDPLPGLAAGARQFQGPGAGDNGVCQNLARVSGPDFGRVPATTFAELCDTTLDGNVAMATSATTLAEALDIAAPVGGVLGAAAMSAATLGDGEERAAASSAATTTGQALLESAAAAPVTECRNDRRWYLGERLIGRVQGPFFKSSFKVGQV